MVILAVIVLVAANLGSCKKSKLTKNQWYVTQATDLDDGSDITLDFAGEIWEFSKEGNYLENSDLKGTWAFTNKKENLTIYKINGNIDKRISLLLP